MFSKILILFRNKTFGKVIGLLVLIAGAIWGVENKEYIFSFVVNTGTINSTGSVDNDMTLGSALTLDDASISGNVEQQNNSTNQTVVLNNSPVGRDINAYISIPTQAQEQEDSRKKDTKAVVVEFFEKRGMGNIVGARELLEDVVRKSGSMTEPDMSRFIRENGAGSIRIKKDGIELLNDVCTRLCYYKVITEYKDSKTNSIIEHDWKFIVRVDPKTGTYKINSIQCFVEYSCGENPVFHYGK